MSTEKSLIYSPPLTPHYTYWYDWYQSQRVLEEEKQKLHEELMKLVRDVMPETTPAPPKAEEPEWLTDQDKEELLRPYPYINDTPCWSDDLGLAPLKNEGTCEGYSGWVDLLSHEEHKEDAEDKEIDLRHERSRAYLYPMENGAVVTVTIDSPTYLLFDKDGNHIVEDGKYVTELAPGWLAIRKEY